MATIPVIHCFDNNYVIPAAVAFLSMLRHAHPQHDYKLYVMHTDITEANQMKLRTLVAQFPNASLDFINMDNKFQDLFDSTGVKGHYAKEVYYKLLVSEIFSQYDYAVVTDVDVLYKRDISEEYVKAIQVDDYYIAGIHIPMLSETYLESLMDRYEKNFTEEERAHLKAGIGGGYLIFNLAKMRRENTSKRLVDYAQANAHRLLQAEQDVLNLCLHDGIYRLPLSSMLCTYFYDIRSETPHAITPELEEAMQAPVQVHYASSAKPWNTPSCTKSHWWFEYLSQTPFFYDLMELWGNDNRNKKQYWKLFGLPICIITEKNKSIIKMRFMGIKLSPGKTK